MKYDITMNKATDRVDFLFRRFSPQKKLEMIEKLGPADLTGISTATFERIVKEAGRKGTEFHCMGFKYHGKIKIQHEDWSNTFQITFTPDDESEDPIIVENVLQDDVVFVIIEYVQYYYECRNSAFEEIEIAV